MRNIEEHQHWSPAEGECVTCGAAQGQAHDAMSCLPDPEQGAADLVRQAEQDAQAPSITDVWAALEALGAASNSHDVQGYRAALSRAHQVQATPEQILDAWQWGWTGRTCYPGMPPFDAQGNPQR